MPRNNHSKLGFIIFIIFLFCMNSTFSPLVHSQEKKVLINHFDGSVFPDDAYVEKLLRLAHMPGMAVGIISEDGTVNTFMYGEENRITHQPPSKDTIFYAGSLSKTVTATAVMKLYEEGKIDLDGDVQQYLPFNLRHPDYPSKTITTRMLLTHTAGFSNIQWRLFYYFSLLHYPREWLGEYLQPDGFIYHPDNWNEYPPGEGIYYSSIGYELLGLIIEQLSGVSFESYCKQNIFLPLSMNNTSFQLSDLHIDQFSTIYGYLLGIYFPLPHYENHNDAAGGMYTSIEDISHFLFMHMNNGSYNDVRILQPETIELMHTAQFTDLQGFDIYKDNRKYGFGWIVWPDEKGTYQHGLQGHLGNVPGGLSSMTLYNNTGVIFFGNEWFRVSYQQTFVMGWLREYFHTKKIPTRP